MQVRATRTGYDGQRRRREGDVFEWPKGKKLGSWVVPTDPKDGKAQAEVDKARERAEHAKLMREAIGQPVVPGEQGKAAE